MNNISYRLVAGNPNSVGAVPKHLLGAPVQVLEVDERLGLTTVEWFDVEKYSYQRDQFDSECVEKQL